MNFDVGVESGNVTELGRWLLVGEDSEGLGQKRDLYTVRKS